MEEDYLILKADSRNLFTTITKKNYQQLQEIISDENKIPIFLIVLFYKSKCLSYYIRHNYDNLPPFIPGADCGKEIFIAVKLSKNNRNVVRPFRNLDVPWMYPITIKSSYGVKIEEEFSLNKNTLVKHILQKIYKIYSIPIEWQELYHHGRSLQNDEFLADLFFTQDEFTSNVTLVISFAMTSYKQVELFNQKYYKTLEITLESLTGKSLIDIAQENIWSVSKLKEFIKETRRIPVRQQTLLHQGTILNEHEMFYDRFMLFEDDSNDSRNIIITLMVQPYYISVKFTSDHLFSDDGYMIMEFSAMTTVREMKARIAEVICLNAEKFALISFEHVNSHTQLSDFQYENELTLDDIMNLSFWPDLSQCLIEVVQSICFEIQGESQIEYLIRSKDQTIKELRKELEISYGYIERQCKLVLQNGLIKNDTPLTDVAHDEILLFHVQQNKSCVLS